MDAYENALRHVIPAIEGAGFRAMIAGGAVRSMLMGEKPADIDICSDAPPRLLADLFPGARDISRNMAANVFSIRAGNFTYEIAALPRRGDFVSSLREDAATRDFTINAMFMDGEGKLLDFFGGEADARHRLLRATGNAENRFGEDPLRIMRGARFAASYGLQIEASTFRVMKERAPALKRLPQERVAAEIEKMMALGGACFALALQTMLECGALEAVLPEVAILAAFPHDPRHHPEAPDVLGHVLAALRVSASDDPRLLWAILLHDVGKAETYMRRFIKNAGRWSHTYHGHDKAGAPIVEKIGARLKLPRKTMETARYCAGEHMKLARLQEMRTPKILKRFEHPFFAFLVDVSKADALARGGREVKAALAAREEFLAEFRLWADFSRQVNGDMVMAECALPPGPLAGKVINLSRCFIIQAKCADWAVIKEKMRGFARSLAGESSRLYKCSR